MWQEIALDAVKSILPKCQKCPDVKCDNQTVTQCEAPPPCPVCPKPFETPFYGLVGLILVFVIGKFIIKMYKRVYKK